MKKIYFFLLAILATALIARSQKKWVGPAVGGSWAVGGNWSGGVVPGPTDSVVLDGGITGTINNVANVTVRNLTVTDNSNVTLEYSAGGPARTLTISNTNGNNLLDLTIVAGSQLTIAGTNFTGIALATNADASIAGTLTINSGRTYNTGGGSSNTSVTGTIDNRGIVTNNMLSFASGSFYIHSRNGGFVPVANWDNNSNCNITGVTTTIPTPASFAQDFGNFTWDCSTQTGNLSFIGNLKDIDGNFTVANTGGTGAINLSITGVNFTLTIGGDYVQTGGTLNMIGSAGICNLELNGNFNMSNGTLRRGGGTCNFIFDRNGAQTFTKSGGTISGAINFSINNNSTVDFGLSVLNGTLATFTLNSGAKLITSHPAGLNSAGAAGSVQTAIRSFSVDADYEFRGANTGVFNTGTSLNTQPSLVRNLTINNTSGSVTLSKPVTIENGPTANRLYLQNGALITTATNILTLDDNVQATGIPGLQANNYNLNSFVHGPLKKEGNDQFIFPVGKIGSGLRKIGIIIPEPPVGSNTSTSFTAEFIRGNPQTLSTTLSAGLERLSACEYWTLDRTGTNQVRVLLSWENNSGCPGQYVTDISTLRVAHLIGGTWINEGNQLSSATGNNAAGTITSINAGIINFSPFALASSSAIENPLPVVFADVKAYEKNNGVQIEWSNLTEKDVAEYTVERSANGRDFSAIGKQSPTSNQNDKASYDAFDAIPGAGANYYRIKAEETTGKIVYSKILSVNIGKESHGLRLYPNPVNGNQVTIILSNLKRGQYNLRIINTAGQDVYKQIISNQSRTLTQTLNIPSSVKPGVYSMVLTGDNYRETKTFIMQ